MRTATAQINIGRLYSTKTLFFVFSAILVSLFFSYVYLVNATVKNIVARERIEKTISETTSNIAELEVKYMSLKNSVTLEVARAKGFADASPTRFLTRNEKTTTLTYNSR